MNGAASDGYENESGCRRVLKKLLYGLATCYSIRPGNSSDAAELCLALHRHGVASTLGKLSKLGDEPGRIVDEYRLASNTFKGSGAAGQFYLSVKPPALNFDAERAAAIAATALQNGHGVHFDAHKFSCADLTLGLLEEVMRRNPTRSGPSPGWSFGLTLPSRWKRSRVDARWIIKKGVRPRLVKGDFKAGPSDEVEPAEGLLALVDLLAGEVAELAVATHDCALAREAVIRCRRAGSAVQLELFFGMPSAPVMALSRELQVPVRFYVPYGETLLIYLVRDLLTNPQKILRRGSYQVLGRVETKLARIIGSL